MKKSLFYQHAIDAAQQENTSIGEIFAKVKAMGFDGLECEYTLFSKDPKGFKAEIDKAGLEVSNIDYYVDFGHVIDEKALAVFLEDAVTVGAKKVLVIPGFIENEEDRDHDMAEIARGLNIFCDMAEEKGIQLTLEDYDLHISPVSTIGGLKYFMDRVPKIGFTFDTGNFMVNGESELVAFDKLGDRLKHFHLKDRVASPIHEGDEEYTAIDGNKYYPCPVGAGVVDTDECIRRVKAEGYEDYVTVEHFGSTHQMEFLAADIKYLEALI